MVLLGEINWSDAKEVFSKIDLAIIPVGSTEDRMIAYSLIVYSHVPEEQGSYAAATALRIISGENPGDIPVMHKNQSKVFINLDIANKFDVVIPFSLLKIAEIYSTRP